MARLPLLPARSTMNVRTVQTDDYQIRPSSAASMLDDVSLKERATHELLHRANGGMNNAAISLELLGASLPIGPAQTQDAGWLVAAALRGLTQAVRSLELMGASIGLTALPTDDRLAPYVADIVHMLNAVSRRNEVYLEAATPSPDRHAATLDVARLASVLMEGIAAIEKAGPGARVRMRCDDPPLSFRFDARPPDSAT